MKYTTGCTYIHTSLQLSKSYPITKCTNINSIRLKTSPELSFCLNTCLVPAKILVLEFVHHLMSVDVP